MHVVRIFGSPCVPTDVLVDAHHVEGIGERIIQSCGAAFDMLRVEGGGDKSGGIELAGFVGEIGKELGAGWIVRGFIRDGPENDGGLVAVTPDHLFEHGNIFGIDLGLIEGDVLPVGDFRPDQDTVAVCSARHTLVVRVMTETDEVGVGDL